MNFWVGGLNLVWSLPNSSLCFFLLLSSLFYRPSHLSLDFHQQATFNYGCRSALSWSCSFSLTTSPFCPFASISLCFHIRTTPATAYTYSAIRRRPNQSFVSAIKAVSSLKCRKTWSFCSFIEGALTSSIADAVIVVLLKVTIPCPFTLPTMYRWHFWWGQSDLFPCHDVRFVLSIAPPRLIA